MPVLKCFASLATGRNTEKEKNTCFSFVRKKTFEILQPGILTTATRKAFQSSFTGNGAEIGDDESQHRGVAACISGCMATNGHWMLRTM